MTEYETIDEFVTHNVSLVDEQWVQDLTRQQLCRRNRQSPQWLGFDVAKRFGLDLRNRQERAWVWEIIFDWLDRGIIKKGWRYDLVAGQGYSCYVAGVSSHYTRIVEREMKEKRN